jgi:hypothetical protein
MSANGYTIVYVIHIDHRSKQVNVMFDSFHTDETQAREYIEDRQYGGRYYLPYYIYSLLPPCEEDIVEKYPNYQCNYINNVPAH